jgi:threonine/homoserine/homoserine lactone efflux protein
VISAFLAGAAAGYGIAIPIGAIGILIVETGLRRGFRAAAAAGAGTATADGIYFVIAALFGTALAGVLEPVNVPLRVAAVAVLVAIAGRGLLGVRRAALARRNGDAPMADRAALSARTGAGRTFLAFLGLTLLNPMTVTYFAALILGLGATGSGPVEKAAFVAGAVLASLSWQELLATAGALLHRRLPPGLVIGVGLAGNLIILAFAGLIAVDLLT